MTRLKSRPFARILEVLIDPEKGMDAATSAMDKALRSAAVLHVKGGNTDLRSLDFWAAVNEKLGAIDHRGENPVTLERVPAVWNDIRYDPALATAYRHSKTAQPLHTDGAYNDNPPEIGFFYCEAQARSGGNTFFLDADVLCDILKKEEPELYARLTTTIVKFGKGTARGQAVPIIGHDFWGPVLNWNYYRVAKGQSEDVHDLVETFFKWLDERIVQQRAFSFLRLAPGDCMVFHDLRCLHGRESYEAEIVGERCLWNLNFHWTGHVESVETASA